MLVVGVSAAEPAGYAALKDVMTGQGLLLFSLVLMGYRRLMLDRNQPKLSVMPR